MDITKITSLILMLHNAYHLPIKRRKRMKKGRTSGIVQVNWLKAVDAGQYFDAKRVKGMNFKNDSLDKDTEPWTTLPK